MAHLKVEPTAILGHSFGGKVALTYVEQCMEQDRPSREVVKVDEEEAIFGEIFTVLVTVRGE